MSTDMRLTLNAREVSEFIAHELKKGDIREPLAGVLDQAVLHLQNYVRAQVITGGIDPDSEVLTLPMN